MQTFKDGMKRLRVAGAPRQLKAPPFVVLSREVGNGVHGDAESWLVRGWSDSMRDYFPASGATLRDVQDLDLEEGFVELLRTMRARSALSIQ
jgi:hypothetical protein